MCFYYHHVLFVHFVIFLNRGDFVPATENELMIIEVYEHICSSLLLPKTLKTILQGSG